jgi:hypothetical protein
MIQTFQRCLAASLRRLGRSPIQPLGSLAILSLLVGGVPGWPGLAAAQPSPSEVNSVQSASGQFVATGPRQLSPLARLPGVATNADLVRLEPALLSVSAERIKDSFRRKLGIDPNAPWQGKIFLVLHPAQSLDEDVTIISQPFLKGWNYRVQLPDVLSQARFLRAITCVLLLELANRNATEGRAAEIPGWLTDGLAQQSSGPGAREIVLSAPGRLVNGLPQNRLVATQRAADPLADARRVLRDRPALTFAQMSWPTDAQRTGRDGGVYRASAQLFVSELLGLKNGPAQLRAMLAALPGCYNWQTAFQNAFREDFPQTLDLEKWWALQVVGFVAQGPGPRWTPAVSREKLDEILSVPVAVWTASNTLPARTDVSLQAVIRNFEPERQTAILQTKLRDLELAQLRMAAPLAAITDEYRLAIAGYLGQKPAPRALPWRKHPPPQKTSAGDTLKKLDELDTRRQAIESSIKPDVFRP